MSQTLHKNNQEEWLKVLGKGMITLPKKWRDDMGIENGDIVKARKEGNKVVIESKPQSKPTAPYRVYTTAEINEFLEEDSLPEELAQKVQNTLTNMVWDISPSWVVCVNRVPRLPIRHFSCQQHNPHAVMACCIEVTTGNPR